MARGLDDVSEMDQARSSKTAGERPAPLNFTHHGEPVTLGLNPIPPAPSPVRERSRSDNGERPAPLNFFHQGKPAALDLSRYQFKPVDAPASNQPSASLPSRPGTPEFTHMGKPFQFTLPAAVHAASSGPQLPRFTHNGQPAVLDLSAFQAPQSPHANGFEDRNAGAGERPAGASGVVPKPNLLGRPGMSGLSQMLARGGAHLSSALGCSPNIDNTRVEEVAETTSFSPSPR
jgi:hypothetical protein